MTVTRWMLTALLVPSVTEVEVISSQVAFRPTHIRTNATKENVSSIDGIYCGDNPVNQLIHPVDAYYWSMEVLTRLRNEFYKAHNLLGKSDVYIDDYLDENGLSIPDNGAVLLPSIAKGQKIRFTGKFGEITGLTVLGCGA